MTVNNLKTTDENVNIMTEEKQDKRIYVTQSTKDQFDEIMKSWGFKNQNDFMIFLLSKIGRKGDSSNNGH